MVHLRAFCLCMPKIAIQARFESVFFTCEPGKIMGVEISPTLICGITLDLSSK